jgi:hypothetical protein
MVIVIILYLSKSLFCLSVLLSVEDPGRHDTHATFQCSVATLAIVKPLRLAHAPGHGPGYSFPVVEGCMTFFKKEANFSLIYEKNAKKAGFGI